MDTIKDKQQLDALVESGEAPWRAWSRDRRDRDLMLALSLAAGDPPVERVLALGCHADDIEIGCGGTLLSLTRAKPDLQVTWVVLARGRRARRGGARRARRVPRRRGDADVRVHEFRDGFLPYVGRRGQGRVREAEGRSSRISSSRTRGTTSTRTTGSPASSRGTRSATT